MRAAARLSLLVAFSFCVSSVLNAQSQPTALSIRGTVVDPMGAPISGARVTVASSSNSTPVSATTDQTGAFTFSLQPGQYTVRVHADGFRDAEQRVAASSATAVPTEFVLAGGGRA